MIDIVFAILFPLISVILFCWCAELGSKIRDMRCDLRTNYHLTESERVRLDKVEPRLAALEERVEKMKEKGLELAGGGTWRTQSGYHLRIRDMSTNHLQNTLKMFKAKAGSEPFVSMAVELKRREEDKEWERKTQARAENIAKWEADCAREEEARIERNMQVMKSEGVLQKFDQWLETKKGRGISINTVRKKIAELLK